MTPRLIGAGDINRMPRETPAVPPAKPTVEDLEREGRRDVRMLAVLAELAVGAAVLYALMWLACWP